MSKPAELLIAESDVIGAALGWAEGRHTVPLTSREVYLQTVVAEYSRILKDIQDAK